MKTIPRYLILVSSFFCNFCYSQSEGKVHIMLESTWDGTYLIYNSHFALIDSSVVESDVPSELSFTADMPDFYFIASKRGNKMYRQFVNLYFKPGDSLQIVSNRMGMHFSGNATYLNDFTFNERYGLTNRYLEDSYNLEPIKASALFDSVRYARKVI